MIVFKIIVNTKYDPLIQSRRWLLFGGHEWGGGQEEMIVKVKNMKKSFKDMRGYLFHVVVLVRVEL